jgi:hypothetical protein
VAVSESATLPDTGTERWKPVPDWEGLYEVSDLGRVRSLDRVVPTSRGSRRYRGRLLHPHIRSDGYPEVTLCNPGEQVKRMVHLLVLEAFVSACPEGQEALHGPAGKLDASLPNLHWGTRSENIRDRLRDGQDNRGERHGNAKLTQAIVDEIRARYAAGERQTSIADSLYVMPANVWAIVHGKSWSYS